VAEQELDDADIGLVLEQMSGKGMPQRMDGDVLGKTRRRNRRTAGGMQHPRLDRLVSSAPRETVGRKADLELPPKDRTCSGLRLRADELARGLIS
jgi:hypothetical protein